MESLLFVVAQIVTTLASPLTLFLILGLILIPRVQRTMERPRLRSAFWGLWVLVFVLGLPIVTDALLKFWEVPRTEIVDTVASEPHHWDAIVILGGSVEPAASTGWHIEVNETSERIIDGARLWHEGRAPLILVTGGSGDLHHPEAREAPLMKRLLEGMGVSSSAILMEPESRNSFENAVFSQSLLAANGVKSVLLVTSALHMKRALAIFRKAGFVEGDTPAISSQAIHVDAFSVDTLREPLVFPESVLPNARSLVLDSRVIKEMVGFAAYKVLGRL